MTAGMVHVTNPTLPAAAAGDDEDDVSEEDAQAAIEGGG
jgi:hypothetical protein